MSIDMLVGKHARVMVRGEVVDGVVAVVEPGEPGTPDADRIVEVRCEVQNGIRYGYRRPLRDVKVFD